jgi:dethiobiotin synthetase
MRGLGVTAIKPVISGFELEKANESDTGLILQALGREVDARAIEDISRWRFAAPLSPDMAAQRECQRIALADVVEVCKPKSGREHHVHFIEGAGGVMSTLGHDFTNLDLIANLEVRVILVIGDYLGSISHTLTACEALRVRDCSPWAIVMSAGLSSVVPTQETAETISRFVCCPVFLVNRGAEAPIPLIDALTA